ncbi:hypothetical protein FOH10_16360 [Nocardia otitidiscaviarum]|uniref:Uncharacterized protein n=1 Tax=Nocardia otitidiscaviarum TaxID=1823 RepID=A0A516NMB7_9NOCA|nr:hypothetical protein [Nocardia otitidiscaviarum]MCP9624691.1 hypothetical protein [Nocardia otitidiscaviarum]QDP80053.1 hypothetical protein FOH10_16360 [Nocardia otitidiscaviarum]
MAKAVEQTRAGFIIAHAGLGLGSDGTAMSVARAVHDGDTVTVHPKGNISTRFLGMDTPEVSFTLPADPDRFHSIGSPAWEGFLTDPFAAGLPPFDPPLPAALEAGLRARTGPDCAANHIRHARAATKALEGLIETDRTASGANTADFRFFLAFAADIFDRYGRFLTYLNMDVPNPPRPPSYNERMLAGGWAVPYFIWPNTNPFRKQPSTVAAVPEPGQPITDPGLDRARQAVAAARAARLGIFQEADPLALLPSELRFLGRSVVGPTGLSRPGPDRWVIDLRAGDDRLLAPARYHEIPFAEDRLFVPVEFVPMFVERGWVRD